MKIAIIGAAGMVGRKLAQRLVSEGALRGEQVSSLVLADIVAAERPDGFAGETVIQAGDLSAREEIDRLVAARPAVIFHLAAIVSGEAEQDFDKGYRINMDGMRRLLESIRAAQAADGYLPRLVFTSSIAVFGAPFPETIPEEYFHTPLTSYGTQKAICELLLADYSRRGIFDGIGIRLPTISIRPGKPNKAASGFFSSILREPLIGEEAVLPVSESVRHWFASPRAATGFLLHAAEIDTGSLGQLRTITMPGLSATVGDQIEALRRVAGDAATRLIRREPNETIANIISGWPHGFDTRRAEALGFHAEASFEEIIRVHIEDELESRLPGRA